MQKCSNDSCSREATVICQECGAIMCDECSKNAHEYEPTHNPQRYNPSNDALKKACPIHNEPIEYYIESKGILACSSCMLEIYKGEECKDVGEVSIAKKKILEDHKNELTEVKDRLEENLKYLNTEKEKEEANEKESISKLEKWKEDTIKMIEKIHEERKTAIKKYHKDVNDDLAKKIKETKEGIENLDGDISKVQKDLDTWNDKTFIDHLGTLKGFLDAGNGLITKGNETNDKAEGTETRVTFFTATTKEEDIKQTTNIEYSETPNNIPRVNKFNPPESNCTNIKISWNPIEKIPEKLKGETLNYSVALFYESDTSNPIKVVDVGKNTDFRFDGLTPATGYKVAIRTAFGSDPKHISQSNFVDLNTKDTLDPPGEVVTRPHSHSVDVSWEAPRCLQDRPDLLENVVYMVSIALDGNGSRPIANKIVKKSLNASFDNLEVETSYKVKVVCRYGDSGKDSTPTEKAFSTSKMVPTDYFSEFIGNQTIMARGHMFTPAVEGNAGIGIFKDPIGKDKCVRVSFGVREGVKPVIGFIPKGKISDAAKITEDKSLRELTLCFVCINTTFLLKTIPILDANIVMKKIDSSSDYVMTLEINTHSHVIKAYHNGNLVGETEVPKDSLEYGVDVHPYIVSSREITLISSNGGQPQPQPQPPQRPSPPLAAKQQPRCVSPVAQYPQNPSSPTQQIQVVPYQAPWFGNTLLKQLNQNYTAVQKIGGENMYGAIALGSKTLEQRTNYTFKVAFSPGDKHTRIGLAHKDALTSNMNDPKLFKENKVVYIDLAENCIIAGNTKTPFTNKVPNGPQKTFHICMSVATGTGQITFDFSETAPIRLGSIDLRSDLSNFYPFVALSGNNSIMLEN